MRVLGIETSCDETGVAIYDTKQGLLSNVLYSQIKLHRQFGGVVPELASRDHVRKLIPLVAQALKQAKCKKRDLSGIAYTAGPGLIGALLVGACFAHAFAHALGIPSIPVHHLEAHVLAVMLESKPPNFPFLALLVSGGHTMLVQMDKLGKYKVLGETLDDAVGEAFDKTAKLLGLSYPGGAALSQLAKQGSSNYYHFTRPMMDRKELNFSFSGLKTYALHTWLKSKQDDEARANIAFAFQEAAVEILTKKCQQALQKTGLKRLCVAGGVGANEALRYQLSKLEQNTEIVVYYPRIEFCTDNGAMIAYAGCRHLNKGQVKAGGVFVNPRWSLVGGT